MLGFAGEPGSSSLVASSDSSSSSPSFPAGVQGELETSASSDSLLLFFFPFAALLFAFSAAFSSFTFSASFLSCFASCSSLLFFSLSFLSRFFAWQRGEGRWNAASALILRARDIYIYICIYIYIYIYVYVARTPARCKCRAQAARRRPPGRNRGGSPAAPPGRSRGARGDDEAATSPCFSHGVLRAATAEDRLPPHRAAAAGCATTTRRVSLKASSGPQPRRIACRPTGPQPRGVRRRRGRNLAVFLPRRPPGRNRGGSPASPPPTPLDRDRVARIATTWPQPRRGSLLYGVLCGRSR